MAKKRKYGTGTVRKRTDGRWCGVVWYMDEKGERKRKSFSGTTKQEVNKKMTEYIAEFDSSKKNVGRFGDGGKQLFACSGSREV